MRDSPSDLPNRATALLVAALVALLALAAAGCGRRPERPAPAGARDDSAAALFLARDSGGARTLFQLSSGTGQVASVAIADQNVVAMAAVATDGQCAVVTQAPPAAMPVQRLLRFDTGTSELLPVERREGLTVKAVSRDCSVAAFVDDDGELLVSRPEGPRAIGTSSLGKLVYGVALSPDGKRLAFSTMDASCSGETEKMARCPVSLWAIEVAGGVPHLVAGGGKAVAYDPEFSDDGATLTYMTTDGDSSEACHDHVNACSFAIKRSPFEGGTPELLFEDAVHGRRAPDGAMTFRRLGEPVAGAQRSFMRQELFVVRDGRPVRRRGKIWHPLHFISPDSTRIVVATEGDDPGLAILVRDGAGDGPSVSAEARPVGWAVKWQRPGNRLLALARPPALKQKRATSKRR